MKGRPAQDFPIEHQRNKIMESPFKTLEYLQRNNITNRILRIKDLIETLEFYHLLLLEEDLDNNPWRGLTIENHLGAIFEYSKQKEKDEYSRIRKM